MTQAIKFEREAGEVVTFSTEPPPCTLPRKYRGEGRELQSALIPDDQPRLERRGHVAVAGEDADGEALAAAGAAVNLADE